MGSDEMLELGKALIQFGESAPPRVEIGRWLGAALPTWATAIACMVLPEGRGKLFVLGGIFLGSTVATSVNNIFTRHSRVLGQAEPGELVFSTSMLTLGDTVVRNAEDSLFDEMHSFPADIG